MRRLRPSWEETVYECIFDGDQNLLIHQKRGPGRELGGTALFPSQKRYRRGIDFGVAFPPIPTKSFIALLQFS